MPVRAAPSKIWRAYDAQISAYLIKPSDLDAYLSAIRSVRELWFNVVALAPRRGRLIARLASLHALEFKR
jgi:DNA-binding NarL/FixJ family response regulator